MAARWLVLFDADRIREYVFTTGRLREIRGASECVRQLTDRDALVNEYGAWTSARTDRGVIYAGGGAGAIVFPAEDEAQKACRDLERRYREGTAGATLTAVAVEVADGGGNAAEAEAQDNAARKLARRKQSRPYAGSLQGGVVRFCSSDRLQPASFLPPESTSSTEELVGRASAIKRKENHRYRTAQGKSDYWNQFLGQIPAGDHPAWREALQPGQDMGSIGAQSRPRGYVSLVYVDGDGIGKRLREIVSENGFHGYQQLSEALTVAATAATARSLADVYGKRPPRIAFDPETQLEQRSLPFEVITIGGDDILLICSGSSGLAVACSLCQLFSTFLGDELTRRNIEAPVITASAGVMIAHDSMPVLTLERGAKELLKSAKSLPEGGGIDFHIVSTPGLATLAEIRAREYQVGSESESALTRRPYSLDAAQELLRHARAIRGLGATGKAIPNSRLSELYKVCCGDHHLARLNVLGVHARLDASNRATLNEALSGLKSVDDYPYSAKEGKFNQYRTALVDLLEASEFVDDEWNAV